VERDPADPGGTTKYGIDQRSHPHIDIANLTREQALEIYYSGEWSSCRCGTLKPPWDLAVFDAAVNIGSGRTIKLLQQTVGTTVDGFIGPKTIAAVNQAPVDDLGEFLDLRESYYRALPQVLRNRFLNGWLNRVADLRRKTTEGQQTLAV
jgi:lysozyme family protein